MAIVMTEDDKSRSSLDGDNPFRERLYTLRGSSDDAAIRAHVLANTATALELLPRKSVEIEVITADTVSDDGLYKAIVTYGLLVGMFPGESSFSFSTMGGIQHITQSISSVSRTALEGAVAPNFKGAINVTPDSVAGTDIPVSTYAFEEQHVFLDSAIDNTYKGRLAVLTGRVNGSSYKGFSAGEVLFLGVQGRQRKDGSDNWDLDFAFAASPNQTDIIVGAITVPSKWGWEFLWVKYQDIISTESTSKFLVKQPQAAYVEKVFILDDLEDVGIGL